MARSYKPNELGKFLSDLKKQTEDALIKDVSREIYSTIQRFILEEVYSKFKPEEYQRSYELLNSLKISPVTSNGNIISVRVYFPDELFKSEEHKMRYNIEQLGLSKGDMPTITDVVEILERGLNPYRPDAQIMNKSVEELRTSGIILKSLVQYLRSKGYKVI